MRITQQRAYNLAQQDLKSVTRHISDMLGCGDIVLVGGAVRDALFARMVGRNVAVKDYDIMLPRPLVGVESNPNVICVMPNSMGGAKLEMRDGSVIDVFQQYFMQGGASPKTVVANHFDFNCNCVMFSQRSGKIEDSAYWLHFLETLQLQRTAGYNEVPLYALILRALKFQQNFKDKFGVSVRIEDQLVQDVINSNYNESDAYKYAQEKIKNDILRNKVWNKYKEIKK